MRVILTYIIHHYLCCDSASAIQPSGERLRVIVIGNEIKIIRELTIPLVIYTF